MHLARSGKYIALVVLLIIVIIGSLILVIEGLSDRGMYVSSVYKKGNGDKVIHLRLSGNLLDYGKVASVWGVTAKGAVISVSHDSLSGWLPRTSMNVTIPGGSKVFDGSRIKKGNHQTLQLNHKKQICTFEDPKGNRIRVYSRIGETPYPKTERVKKKPQIPPTIIIRE